MNAAFTFNKKEFSNHLNQLLQQEAELREILFELFINKGVVYIVGGYIRDYINGVSSRDLDMIVDIDSIFLQDIITKSNIEHEINRHGGIKLIFQTITADIWSLNQNWAFKKKLVKLNDEDKLHSIAKGCFYNYDALAVNILNFNYNIQYYNEFINSNTLNILQKRSIYKILNPTKEANILRAFFLKVNYECNYSNNTIDYLYRTLIDLSNKDTTLEKHLESSLNKYPKYRRALSLEKIKENIDIILDKDTPDSHQFTLDFR